MTACKTEDDCPTPMWCRSKSRCPRATSELAPHESAGPSKVVAAVATGSLPVLTVEYILQDIEHRALCLRAMSDRDYWDKPTAAKRYVNQASELEDIAKKYRAQMASMPERQPEENQ